MSMFKKGGGWLNDVDAVITGYQFVVGDEVTITKGMNKGEQIQFIKFIPTFRQDGASEDVKSFLDVGTVEQFGDVSEDGLTLHTPEGQRIYANADVAVFIASLVEAGFPESRFDGSVTDDQYNFEPIIGTRVQLIQEVNADKTLKVGKQVNKKTGKEYDRRDLKVSAVHALPVVGKLAATSKLATGKTVTNGSGKAKVAKVDVSEQATEALVEILSEAGGSLAKPKLSLAIIKRLGKDPNREAVRTWLQNDDNLAGIDVIDYNAKSGLIELT